MNGKTAGTVAVNIVAKNASNEGRYKKMHANQVLHCSKKEHAKKVTPKQARLACKCTETDSGQANELIVNLPNKTSLTRLNSQVRKP